jgi:hypothetical protein
MPLLSLRKVFEEHAKEPQSSILSQLSESNKWRLELVLAAADALGISELMTEHEIIDLQLRLAHEIEVLKNLMG